MLLKGIEGSQFTHAHGDYRCEVAWHGRAQEKGQRRCRIQSKKVRNIEARFTSGCQRKQS